MLNAQLAATTIHRRRHPSCKTPTSHGGGVGEIHGVPLTCLGEVSDLSETSPRRLGEVSGKSRTSRGSRGRLGEVADKSATSPGLPRDVSDLSRGSFGEVVFACLLARGRLGEVSGKFV